MNKTINRLNLLNSFLFRKAKIKGMPLEIGIELTNHCNLACIMCPRQEMVSQKIRPLGVMSEPLYKKIINEISGFAEIVYLHGLGESLLHPKLFEFIAYAKEKSVPLGLSTNATLLSRENSVKLLNSGLDYLILAVDGASKATYEKIRVGANFTKVESNIKFFLAEKRRRQKKLPFCVIQFVQMPENSQETTEFIKKWKKSGVDAVRIKPKIALKDSDKKGLTKRYPYCFHIFRQLNIAWNGEVMACCEDVNAKYSLGNIKDQTLTEIWNGPKMCQLRRINFLGQQDQITTCRKCTYPQPGIWQASGALIVDHLTLKKALSFWERLFG